MNPFFQLTIAPNQKYSEFNRSTEHRYDPYHDGANSASSSYSDNDSIHSVTSSPRRNQFRPVKAAAAILTPETIASVASSSSSKVIEIMVSDPQNQQEQIDHAKPTTSIIARPKDPDSFNITLKRRFSLDASALHHSKNEPLTRSKSVISFDESFNMNKRTIIERMKQATKNMALEQFIDELESHRQSLKNKSRVAWYCESQYGLTCGMAAINAFFQSPLLNITNLKSFLLENYQAFMPELDHYTLSTFIDGNIEANGINADEVVSIVNKFIDGPSHTPSIQHKIGWSNALMNLLHIPGDGRRSAVVEHTVKTLQRVISESNIDDEKYWPIIALFGHQSGTMGHFVTFVFEYGKGFNPVNSGAWFKLDSAQAIKSGRSHVNTKITWAEFSQTLLSGSVKALMLPANQIENIHESVSKPS